MNIKMIKMALAGVVLSVSSFANANLIINGDFETGDFTGWSTSHLGGSSLGVLTNPGDPDLGSSPSIDHYAFAGNQGGPSQNIFWQTFAVPNSLSSLNFSFDYTYRNFSSSFVNPTVDTLDYLSVSNQQFRVEILTGSANFLTVTASDIVFTAFQTVSSSPNPVLWTNLTQDITTAVSAYQGQNLIVRFAQVDNNGPFDIGFDNVVLNATTVSVPDPATLGIFSLSLLALTASRKSKKEKALYK